MVLSEQEHVPAHILALPAILDMSAAQTLKDLLVEAVASHQTIIADGSGVERAGTPALQLMLAASRAMAANGGKLILSKPSQTLAAALSDLGIAKEFEQSSSGQ